MTGYNKINGDYAGGNRFLIEDVLKGAWGYPGWVMSDWGATPSWEFALAGLDQESGVQVDVAMWKGEAFTEPLRTAYAAGDLPKERLSEMVQCILVSMYQVGIDSWGPAPEVDMAEHHGIALETARQGIVVLKNDGALPISATSAHIAIIGGHAQVGVVTGCGSSAVTPPGGYAEVMRIGGAHAGMSVGRNLYLLPSSPLAELTKLLPDAQIEFDPGMSPAEAAITARRVDLVIAFAIRVEGEGFDNADLTLPWGQDAVIEAVAAANPNTIVVLETGNPVTMPWHDDVRAIVEAWYPGQAGGQAIAEVLTGVVNPSGRLPLTFPADVDQTPRPDLPGLDTAWGTPTTIEYTEGAEVGYRWFAKTGAVPRYAFGHGLSYTSFDYRDLHLTGGDTVAATFTVTNTGERAGADVPQLYLTDGAGDRRMRLIGFERVHLEPGESQQVSLTADARLLARFDTDAGQWHVASGTYDVSLGAASDDLVLHGEVDLSDRRFGS